MNKTEKEIIEVLQDLKENHHAIALKAEFEAEGADYIEVLKLKNFADVVGLNLAVKIGGCEAIRDMQDAKKIGANIIIAPMIES